jgi:Domain of unknown function (DUF4389)
VEKRSRSRTGFRFILAIPWLILGSVYVLGAFIIAFLAWFAIVFTARYPQGLYSFNAGVLGFIARANAFSYLQTDQWPPFGFEEAPDYPIRAQIDPPLERYNRWKTPHVLNTRSENVWIQLPSQAAGMGVQRSRPPHGTEAPDVSEQLVLGDTRRGSEARARRRANSLIASSTSRDRTLTRRVTVNDQLADPDRAAPVSAAPSQHRRDAGSQLRIVKGLPHALLVRAEAMSRENVEIVIGRCEITPLASRVASDNPRHRVPRVRSYSSRSSSSSLRAARSS